MKMERSSYPEDLLADEIDIKLNFHPLFASLDADVILGAKDETIFFRVHSYTLKTTSGWFRQMFTLPQKTPPTRKDVINLDEDADTLEALLRMICGLPVLRLESFDIVEAILYAAEKYDMPGPQSIGELSNIILDLRFYLELIQPYKFVCYSC